MLIRLVRMEFRANETNHFIQLFKEVQSDIAAFPGCKQVNLCTDPENASVFYTHSIWTSEQALENYRNSELFKRTWARTKVLFAAKPMAFSLLPTE